MALITSDCINGPNHLGLCALQLGDEGCGALAAVLPRAHGLTALDLSHNIRPDDGDTGSWVPMLAAALPVGDLTT